MGIGTGKENEAATTGRSEERKAEDQEFLPVIVKRSDEAKRHPDDILELAIREGHEQLNRRFISLMLSSIVAGLILGFSVLAGGVMRTIIMGTALEPFHRILAALLYPLGFIICIMSGTELFTEHTATAVYPVLDQRVSWVRLIRLWGVVILGNLLGTFASAVLLSSADQVVSARRGYVELGRHLIAFSPPTLFASAVLAGWLMAQGAWLIMATPSSLAQIVCIYLVTFLIGLGALHHSIAGAVELFTAMILDRGFPRDAGLTFLIVAILGNLVGGSGFVALLNYAHVRKTQVNS
jgi:formate-nitrite transporter family protein